MSAAATAADYGVHSKKSNTPLRYAVLRNWNGRRTRLRLAQKRLRGAQKGSLQMLLLLQMCLQLVY